MKKKRILIVRSVSLQLLDRLLPEVFRIFGIDNEYILLSHSHAVERCKKYKGISNIIGYSEKGDFKFGKLPEDVKEGVFDIIIVPVSNFTGAGFLNVFYMAAKIKSKEIFMLNVKGELRRIRRSWIMKKRVFWVLYSSFSLFFTILFAPIYLLLLFFEFLLSKIIKQR